MPTERVRNTSPGADLDTLLLRVGLLGAGLVCVETAFAAWLHGQPVWRSLSLGINLVGSLFGLVLIVLSLVRRVDRRLSWLVLVALVGSFAVRSYLFDVTANPATFSRTDSEMITVQAIEALQRGENPYRADHRGMLGVYRDRGLFVTPMLDGSIQHRAAYPGLSYLLLAGLDALGLEVTRVVRLFHVLALVLLFVGAPRRYRPVVLLPLWLLDSFTGFSLIGVHDIIWCSFLLAMVLWWDRPVLRALAFGAACAFRQQPWFLAPFLLVLLWHETPAGQRRRRLGQFVGLGLAVFAATNLPFVVWDFGAWWRGTFEHSFAAFNWFSSGLSVLTQYGVVPWPRTFYTVTQLALLALMLLVQIRHPRWVGQAFWLFPLIYFWLYYRSLTHYWIYWLPPLLLALVRTTRAPGAMVQRAERGSLPGERGARNTSQREEKPAGGSRATVAAGLALLAGLTVYGGALMARGPQATVVCHTPAADPDGYVRRLEVTVRNASPHTMHPRFAVRTLDGVQPLAWSIRSGPGALGPGASGAYVIAIHPNLPQRALSRDRGGQLVVTDAQKRYALYAVASIRPLGRGAARPMRRMRLPSPDVYHTSRGERYLEERNIRQAVVAFWRALHENPDNSAAHFGLAEAAFWQGNRKEAIHEYRRSIALGHRCAGAHKGIGWCQLGMRRDTAAGASFRRALALYRAGDDPARAVHIADCLKGLALVALMQGQCDAALEALGQARASFPAIDLDGIDLGTCSQEP